MVCRYEYLVRYPGLFLQMTGLRIPEFAQLLCELLPSFRHAEQHRLSRPGRQRALGGGRPADLPAHDQILLTLVWLHQHPTNDVLAFLFDVSDSTVSRVRARVLPLLEAAGRVSAHEAGPGRKYRKNRAVLLAELPDLGAVITLSRAASASARHS